MPGVPPDAVAQLKKSLKGLFRKKAKKDESTPTATTDEASLATTKPSETAPAAPAPATAPEPATTAGAPVTTGSAPAQPAAAVPSPSESKIDHAADLTEVKKATQTPEPVGAVAPLPPTAASTQTPAADAPKLADAETTEASAQPSATAVHLDMPAIPTTKPAAGMSATSGPMGDEPDFGNDAKEESPLDTVLTPAATASTADHSAPAEKQ